MNRSDRNSELFCEIEPEIVSSNSGFCYVLFDRIQPGLGGFFIKIGTIETPIFLHGHTDEYRFFQSKLSKYCLVIFKRNRFVASIYAPNVNISIISGPFDEFKNDEVLKFYNSTYPIPSENPDILNVSPSSCDLAFAGEEMEFVERSAMIRKYV